MAGNIVKLDDQRWRVRIHLGYDENGKRQDFTKVIHGLKKDAERFLRDALRRKDLGEALDPDDTTLSAFLDKWLAVRETELRRRSYLAYKSAANLHIRPTLGKHMVRSITTQDIQTAYGKILKHTTKPKTGAPRPMGPRGLHSVHTVLHCCLEYAVETRVLQFNPASYARLPKVPKPAEREHFTTETGLQFITAARQHPIGIVFVFAIITGLRPGEYYGLQWRDLDWNTRRLTVRRGLCRYPGEGWVLEDCKTEKSHRTLVLPPGLIDLLREHKAKQDEAKALAQNLWQDHGFIFTQDLGEPMNSSTNAEKSFRDILRAAGLPETMRPYDLRHGCATVMLEQGDDIKSISDQLGHASIRITGDTYAHVTQRMKERSADRIGNALLSSTAPSPSSLPES